MHVQENLLLQLRRRVNAALHEPGNARWYVVIVESISAEFVFRDAAFSPGSVDAVGRPRAAAKARRWAPGRTTMRMALSRS